MAFYSTSGGLYVRNNGKKLVLTNSGDNNFQPNTAQYKRIVFRGYPDGHFKTMSQGQNLWRVQTQDFSEKDWNYFLDYYLPRCESRVLYEEDISDVKQHDPLCKGFEFPETVLRKMVKSGLIQRSSTIDYINNLYNKTSDELKVAQDLDSQGLDGQEKVLIDREIDPLKESKSKIKSKK